MRVLEQPGRECSEQRRRGDLPEYQAARIVAAGQDADRHDLAAEAPRANQREQVAAVQAARVGRREQVDAEHRQRQGRRGEPAGTLPQERQGDDRCQDRRHGDDERRTRRRGDHETRGLGDEAHGHERAQQQAARELRAVGGGAEASPRNERQGGDAEPHRDEGKRRGVGERALDGHEARPPQERGREQREVRLASGHARSRR